MSIAYVEDSENTTADFQASFAEGPGGGLALSAYVLDGREELSAGELAVDSQVRTAPTPESPQPSRAIYELLPEWMR